MATNNSAAPFAFERLETIPGTLAAQARTVDALRSALEAAGVESIAANGGGPGITLRKGI